MLSQSKIVEPKSESTKVLSQNDPEPKQYEPKKNLSQTKIVEPK